MTNLESFMFGAVFALGIINLLILRSLQMTDKPQMNIMPHRQGQYFVRYYDGLVTGLMPRSEARDLAKIFGGWVKKEPDND